MWFQVVRRFTMGYSSSPRWKSKADVVNEVLLYARGGGCVLLKHRVVTDGVWCAWEVVGTGETYIEMNLIEKQGERYYLKTIRECEHPYYFDCPVGFFKLVSVACAAWRVSVYARHEQLKTYRKAFRAIGM